MWRPCCVIASSLLVSAVSRRELFDGWPSAECGVLAVSTGTSVPRPRVSGLDVSDSALLAPLLTEAPIGFAFIGPDLHFLRMNQTMAGLCGTADAGHIGATPAQLWPSDLALAAEAAVRRVQAGDKPAPNTLIR